ncbi:transcriptional regulator [Streptomyces sp. WAC 06725]|uniref:helix-turn-helix domain-containing protein n=1 Tax=Streptomyces sp. WAC 06725 TaxID=2203209 RepID=UPI000F749C06|nr:helix-turn-helix transcriptional regulator [Streptomyces sp. WAC 06725]RSO31919.1 transcriptional regulator [Streptomyces sp. WAC 06725]
MPVTTHPTGSRPGPPFDAEAARRLREALGMTPAHVAYGIWAAYGIRVAPDTVTAWERGTASPSGAELTALAGALWCAPGELLGAPRTLREHRLARGMAADDLALRIGMDPAAYARMEAAGTWTGSDRQAAELAEALRLPCRALIELTGRDAKLAELLRGAAITRWQAYVRPVAKMVPLPKPRLQAALQGLHGDYQGLMAASLNWGGGGSSEESGHAGRAFLDGILETFWARTGGG